MLENKKSLFKPLNKDFIKIKCCEFCRTFCRTTKFFKLKHQVSIFRNTWCSNGADEQIIFAVFTFNSKCFQISHYCPDIVGNIFFYQIIYYYLILLSYYFQVSFHTFHSSCPYILCTYAFDSSDDNQIYLRKYLL